SNSNVYLSSRYNAIKKINKRYGLNIEVMYNDNVKSEIETFNKNIEIEKESEPIDNNNAI
ncbi:hypothetical protein V6O07_20705, partial [Arthrospira platensis SPKY2]